MQIGKGVPKFLLSTFVYNDKDDSMSTRAIKKIIAHYIFCGSHLANLFNFIALLLIPTGYDIHEKPVFLYASYNVAFVTIRVTDCSFLHNYITHYKLLIYIIPI